MRLTSRRLISHFINLVEQRAILVKFKNDSEGLFPYVWLRDCSLDPKTYTISAAMKGRLHNMRDFDVRVKPLDIALDEVENCLQIRWPGDVLSRYQSDWLKDRCPGNDRVRNVRRQIYLCRECVRPWDRTQIEQRLQRFSRQKFLENDQVLHDFLWAICVDGIAVLKNDSNPSSTQTNDEITVLRAIVDRIGFLQRNHFGDIFEVFPKPDASNMAYAGAEELPYHTDFPSLQHPPQLQMLHMARRAECGGGLSMFTDGFHVAEQMANTNPDLFKLLCTVPLEFVEEGYDVHKLIMEWGSDREERFDYDMVGRHTTIRLDNQNRVVQIQFGNVMRSWFIDHGDPLMIQHIYDALKLFTQLCYAPENQLIFPLKTGDTVLWANTRLLHARSAYRIVGDPARERHVVGCYFDWDVIKSRIRVIRDRLALSQNQQTL